MKAGIQADLLQVKYQLTNEVHLPFVVLQPGLDLLRLLHRVAGGVGEAGKVVDALEVLVGTVRSSQVSSTGRNRFARAAFIDVLMGGQM